MTAVVIRALRVEDAGALAASEAAASERFRDVGYGNVADDDPFTAGELAVYASGGRGWVAVDGDPNEPGGYVLVDVVDGNAHVEQVTVHPDHQGRGIGRLLLDHVAAWARDRRMAAMTLTTYSDVPWNRPLYEHLGWAVLDEPDIGAELRSVRDVEASHGLDPAARVCMRRDVSP
jgi:GNAT superfamily N-acetyltransferase